MHNLHMIGFPQILNYININICYHVNHTNNKSQFILYVDSTLCR